MKHLILATILLAGAAPLAPAMATPLAFSGSQSNVNAPAMSGGRCSVLTVTINNDGPLPLFSTGISNFGNFTTEQSHCLDSGPPLALGAPPTPYYDGQFVYTFADGDTLFGSYSGTLTHDTTPGVIDNIQDFVIDGGTGQFADATGTFHGEGTITFGPNTPPLSQIKFASPVPESSTLALLIGGAGVLMRSRRRSRISSS